MREIDSVGRELKILNNKLNRRAEAEISSSLKQSVTEMQGRVIGFLYRNRDRSIFQRDVEAEFSITRATASKMLSLMERNGLVTRSGVPGDARLKKLELTEAAIRRFQEIHQCMVRFEQTLTRGFTAEERKTLLELLRKLERNVDA